MGLATKKKFIALHLSIPSHTYLPSDTQDTCLSNNDSPEERECESYRDRDRDKAIARLHERNHMKILADEESCAAGAGVFSDDEGMDG